MRNGFSYIFHYFNIYYGGNTESYYCFCSESESCSVAFNSLRPHGLYTPRIIQARMLEWVAFPFSRGSSNPGIEPKSLALQADSLPTEQSEKHSSSLLQHIKPGNSEPTCLAHMSPPQRSPPDQCMFTHAFHPASCHSTWHYLALYWASLVAQMVKNPPEMREIQIQPLGQEDPLDEGNNYQYS